MTAIKNQKKKKIIFSVMIAVIAIITLLGIIFLVSKFGNGANATPDNNNTVNTPSNGEYVNTNDGDGINSWVELDGKKFYVGSDANYLTGYNEIDGEYYFFDNDGVMQTGWQNVNGNDYFFGEDGKRVAFGLVTDSEGNTYYCLEDGGCLKGRHVIAETVYFFDETGKAVSGFVNDDDGTTYYVSSNGSAVKGPLNIDDTWYLFDENGAMTSGWAEYEGNKYYAFNDGKMAIDTFTEIDGKKYCFSKDGKVVTGWLTLENGEQGYASSEGSICLQEAITIDGVRYFFDSNGKLGNGWVSWNGNKGYAESGGILFVGRKTIDGKTYYFDDDGIMQTGWINYADGRQSYADSEGVLVTEERKIGSVNCVFDVDGYLVSKDIVFDKKVALTFDDGPSIYTPIILDAMEATDSRCTFFVVGNRVGSYSNTVKRAYDLGCEIGSHTFEHAYLTELTPDGMKNQIDKTNATVSAITGTNCPVLRPPGGYVDEVVCDNVGVPLILWNVDTKDWSTKNTSKTLKAATEGIKDGDIILMHDLYESTANAVYDIIIELQSQGFECVTVSELAAAKGGAEAGHKYFSFR